MNFDFFSPFYAFKHIVDQYLCMWFTFAASNSMNLQARRRAWDPAAWPAKR